MATTANGLPYPVGTDRVMDGDDAIKALAEKLDPPWIALPLQSGIQAQGGTVPGYRVIAGQVFLRGHVSKVSAGNFADADIVFTLPAGPARPLAGVSLVTAQSGTSGQIRTGRLDISTAGVGTVIVNTGAPAWVSFDGTTFNGLLT